MHIESLPEKTRNTLLTLASVEGIQHFLLVGGTALALHAGHRVSEDLDFAFIRKDQEPLPRDKIEAVLKGLQDKGIDPVFIEHPDIAVEFSEAALDLLDYHQDYDAAGTKLTFRHEEPALFGSPESRSSLGHIQIATLGEIFDSKAIMFGPYCRSRDVFDLWWLMEYGGSDVQRMAEAFARTGQPHNLKTAFARIRQEAFSARDPGYVTLDPRYPHKDEARKLLTEKIQHWLEERASRGLQTPSGSGPHSGSR